MTIKSSIKTTKDRDREFICQAILLSVHTSPTLKIQAINYITK